MGRPKKTDTRKLTKKSTKVVKKGRKKKNRKGMVRLAEDMKQQSGEPSKVSRLKVWVKSRTKKDGTPVNMIAAEKFKKAAELVGSKAHSNSTNPSLDPLSALLGPDNPGHLRAMGRNIWKTKLDCFQVKKQFMAEMEQKHYHLLHQVNELESELARMKRQEEPEIGENSATARARSVNKRAQPKCMLVDWSGSDENVAEGRIISSEPDDFVNDIPLAPLAVKVLVESAIKPDAFLWRPTTGMYNVEHAVGEMIAWPVNKCVFIDHGMYSEDIPLRSPTPYSMNKCKLLSPWSTTDEVVAEGRWQCKEPKALVDCLPLGPNAVKVFVDVVHEPETFLWRPRPEMTYLRDSVKHFVAWPADKCVFESTTDSPSSTSPTASAAVKSVSQSPTKKSRAKNTQAASPVRRSQVFAEGIWGSDNPEHSVHFVPLGPNAVKVWVDVVKVTLTEVWRPSSEIECLGDAIGTCIAWPKDKVILC
ncbi:hypothetical protein Bca4012_058531 [Brassica carinata]